MSGIIDKRFTFTGAARPHAYRGQFIDQFMDHFGIKDSQHPDSFVLRDLLQKTTECMSPARSRQLHEQITRRFRDNISEDRIIDTDKEYSVLFKTVIEIHMEGIRELVENSSSREAWLKASPETIKSLFTLMVLPQQLRPQLMSEEQMAMARSLIQRLDLGPLKEHEILERLFDMNIAGQSGGYIVTQLALFMTDFNIEGGWQDVLITIIKDYPEQIDTDSFLYILTAIKKGLAEKIKALLFQKPMPQELDAQLYQRIVEDIRLLPILVELGHPVAMRALQEIVDGDENSRVVQILQKKMAGRDSEDVESLTSAVAAAIETIAAHELGEGPVVDPNWAGEYELSNKTIVEALKKLIRKRGNKNSRAYLGMVFYALLSTENGKQFFYREETALKEKLGKEYRQPDFINIATFIERIPDIRTSPADILIILNHLKPLLEAGYHTWLRRLEEFAGEGDVLGAAAILHLLDATLTNNAGSEMRDRLFDFFDSGLNPESLISGMRALEKLPLQKKILPNGEISNTYLRLCLDRLMTSKSITRTFQKTFEAVRLLIFEFPDIFGEWGWGPDMMGELDRMKRYEEAPLRTLTDLVIRIKDEFLTSEPAWRQIKTNTSIGAISSESTKKGFQDYLPYIIEIAENGNEETLDAARLLISYAKGDRLISRDEDRQAVNSSINSLRLYGILTQLESYSFEVIDILRELALLEHSEALNMLFTLFKEDYTPKARRAIEMILFETRPNLHKIIIEEMVFIITEGQAYSLEVRTAAIDVILHAADQDIPDSWTAVGKIAEADLRDGRLNESAAVKKLLETDSSYNAEEQRSARSSFDAALGTYILQRYNPISSEIDQTIIDWVKKIVTKLNPAQSLQTLKEIDKKLEAYIDSLDPATTDIAREMPHIPVTVQRLKTIGLTAAYDALRSFERERREIEEIRREASGETTKETEEAEDAEYEEPIIIDEPMPFSDELIIVDDSVTIDYDFLPLNYTPIPEEEFQAMLDEIIASTVEKYDSSTFQEKIDGIMSDSTSFFNSFESFDFDEAFDRLDQVTDAVWNPDIPTENTEYILEALIKAANENRGARIKLSELIKECRIIASTTSDRQALDILYFIAITARDIYPRFGQIARDAMEDIAENLASPQRMTAQYYLDMLDGNFA